MSWFADLAGRAESLLNNLDEQTGAAIRNHNIVKKKFDNPDASRRDSGSPKRQTKITPRKAANVIRSQSPSSYRQQSLLNQVIECARETSPTKKKPAKTTNGPNQRLVWVNNTRTPAGHQSKPTNSDKRKQRRHSFPPDVSGSDIVDIDVLTLKIQNLEVENCMLRKELEVFNNELADMFRKAKETDEELINTETKLQTCEVEYKQANMAIDDLKDVIHKLKSRIKDLEMTNSGEHDDNMEMELSIYKEAKRDLETRIKTLEQKEAKNVSINTKLEIDLRNAQTTISELQNELEKSKEECKRLETDWQTYKVRVKNMLTNKDDEIKMLQEGMNLTEDSKILIEQLENLKEERDEQSETVTKLHNECEKLKLCIDKLEHRASSAERLAEALRETLRDERAAKARVEVEVITLQKEIKQIQIESSQALSNLRNAIREKETEIHKLLESTTSLRTLDTSALNVGDYSAKSEVNDSMQGEKVQYLTDALVSRQGRIDALLADNNMLRIQLDKLENKMRTELANLRSVNNHSVVHLHENDSGRLRNRGGVKQEASIMNSLSVRLGVYLKRYPVFRMFILFYMIGLHFWVLTVLFTSTPENYVPKRAS